jgi:5'-nucleotidase
MDPASIVTINGAARVRTTAQARLWRPFMPRPISLLTALALLAPACADDPAPALDDALDGADDSFGAGKADGIAESCPVLKLANSADFDTLDDDVKLNKQAAQGIIDHREGIDGELGTADDRWFADMAELDAVKFVGEKALERMLEYVADESIECGEVAVQLLAFNDFHGNLRPPSGSSGRIQTGPNPAVDRVDAGGVEFMATHMQTLAAQSPNTLVVAAGDVIGATPLLSALFHDEPTIESMNLLGLDIASVGNHEFDEGPDELLRMQLGGCHPVDGCLDGDDFAGADYNYLAANVIDTDSGEPILPPYEIRRFGNASVAFIGMTLEGTPLVTTPSGVEGLEFLDEAETVNALIPELRERGVEAIVVLLHEGGFSTGLYDECVGISGPLFDIVQNFDDAVDVVVAGHTNAAHVCEIDGKIVTSAASFGRLITDIDLVVDEATGDVVQKSADNVIVTRDVALATEQSDLIAHYDAIAAPFANRIVGSITQTLVRTPNPAGESQMGDLIADAQLAASTASEAEIAFMNPGGIRTDLVFEQISGGEAAGEVTYGELFAVQPFSNNLVTLSLTGAQIDALLEQQWRMSGASEVAVILQVSASLRYTWNSAQPLGSRVDPATITIAGEPLDLARTYRVTVNSFLADGGDGFSVLTQGTDRSGGQLDVDALELFVTAHSPYTAAALDRITRL